jgi:hypothetical protein
MASEPVARAAAEEVGRDAPDRRQPALHDGVRGAAHRADPPPRRAVPAQGAPHEIHEIHQFLDRFYMSRIGIRMLIGQ